jgi:hypothetical protein
VSSATPLSGERIIQLLSGKEEKQQQFTKRGNGLITLAFLMFELNCTSFIQVGKNAI